MNTAFVKPMNENRFYHQRNCPLLLPFLNVTEMAFPIRDYRPCKCMVGYMLKLPGKKWVKRT